MTSAESARRPPSFDGVERSPPVPSAAITPAAGKSPFPSREPAASLAAKRDFRCGRRVGTRLLHHLGDPDDRARDAAGMEGVDAMSHSTGQYFTLEH
ncbi:MAG: hypothetical protein M3Z05_18565 [Gemmatimonadota bacterium]|nr:hypothetical protein [Gemmatimonadota bacterium]